jgi:hypothetical protein
MVTIVLNQSSIWKYSKRKNESVMGHRAAGENMHSTDLKAERRIGKLSCISQKDEFKVNYITHSV